MECPNRLNRQDRFGKIRVSRRLRSFVDWRVPIFCGDILALPTSWGLLHLVEAYLGIAMCVRAAIVASNKIPFNAGSAVSLPCRLRMLRGNELGMLRGQMRSSKVLPKRLC